MIKNVDHVPEKTMSKILPEFIHVTEKHTDLYMFPYRYQKNPAHYSKSDD